MYQTILVPVDGSPLAERALPYAITIAQRAGARLVLFQAIPPSTDKDATAPPSTGAAETYLRDVASHVRGVPTVETRVVVGDPADAILKEIQTGGVDLVVMSTHGRSGVGRWIYGSVADQIMRRASVPIVLVPAHGRAAWPDNRRLRILVSLDGSKRAERVLGPTVALAQALGAELTLIRVVEPYPMGYADPIGYVVVDPTPLVDEAHRYLEETAKSVRESGTVCQIDHELGFAISRIVDVAQQRPADVIAIGTHGSSGLERLVLGSVATGVIQRSEVPILVIRSSGAGS